MIEVYCGVGSNLNQPLKQVKACIDYMSKQFQGFRYSSFYTSKPWGVVDQPDFVNAVVSFKVSLKPEVLLSQLQDIEQQLGRVRHQGRWGPRLIDIDLLLFGKEVIAIPDLKVPHPWMKKRAFVLLPLMELDPSLVFPCGQTIQSCIDCPDIKKQNNQLKKIDTVQDYENKVT